MEELIGGLWHRIITRQAQTDCPEAGVKLENLTSQLTAFYRAMGGSPGKRILVAQPRRLDVRRGLVQRVAGTHRCFPLSWQDDLGLHLPAVLACFSDPALNESLYFWLAALAAKQPLLQHWFADNQRACRSLLQDKPGLARQYQKLVAAHLGQRRELSELPGNERLREEAIRRALCEPGSMAQLPIAAGNPQPVPFWLYTCPLQLISVDGTEPEHDAGTASGNSNPVQGDRKRAERIDDRKETDGLLVFQLESLFSWAEQVELDRCQDEHQEDDIASAAEDLDIITLSRQRRAGAASIKFDLDLPAPQNDDLPVGVGIPLPEWDYRRSRLIENYCLLQPMLADEAPPSPLPEALKITAITLRSRFALLKPQRQWQRRKPQGEELDLEVWLEQLTCPEVDRGRQDFFKLRTPCARELSCLLLADLSMSTDSFLSTGQRVIEVIRDTLLLFAEALNGSGDQFAIYGFSSVKNKQVRFNLLKNFAETYSDRARGRILAIKPGFYTRMGAAIRQSVKILELQKSQQRLLLMVSDGKPNDIDHYEGRYGVEDTRNAIQEARRLGIQPFCVTIDQKANDYLPYLFGDRGYTVINDASRLPVLLPKLYLNLTGIDS